MKWFFKSLLVVVGFALGFFFKKTQQAISETEVEATPETQPDSIFAFPTDLVDPSVNLSIQRGAISLGQNMLNRVKGLRQEILAANLDEKTTEALIKNFCLLWDIQNRWWAIDSNGLPQYANSAGKWVLAGDEPFIPHPNQAMPLEPGLGKDWGMVAL